MKKIIIILFLTASSAWAQLEPVQDSYVMRDDYWGRIVYYDCNTLDMKTFMERVLYYAQVILPETEYLSGKNQIYGHRQVSEYEEMVIQVIPYRSIRFQNTQSHYVSVTIYGENWRNEKLQPETYNIIYEKASDFMEEVGHIAKSCLLDTTAIK